MSARPEMAEQYGFTALMFPNSISMQESVNLSAADRRRNGLAGQKRRWRKRAFGGTYAMLPCQIAWMEPMRARFMVG
jgi:hypothetical protein